MSGQSGSEKRRMPFEVLVRSDWVLYQRLSAVAANFSGGPVTMACYVRDLIDRYAPELPDLDAPAYLPLSQPRERPKPLGSDVQALQTIPPAAGKVAGLTRCIENDLRAQGEASTADALIDVRRVLRAISLWAVTRIELRIEKSCVPIDEGKIRKMAEGLLDSGRRFKASFGDGAVIDEAKTDGLRRYAERLTRLFENLKAAERG